MNSCFTENEKSTLRNSPLVNAEAKSCCRQEKSSSGRQHDAADLSEGLVMRSAPQKDFREEIKPRRKQS